LHVNRGTLRGDNRAAHHSTDYCTEHKGSTVSTVGGGLAGEGQAAEQQRNFGQTEHDGLLMPGK
jgi:hypothetical protein